MITVCALESPLASVTATLKPDGAEIVGGDSVPPAPILKVAGIRAPFGAGGEVFAEPGAGCGVVAVLVLVEAVVVGAGVVGAGLVAAEVVVDRVTAVVVEDVALDPPHPASRRTESSPRTLIGRLTSAA